MSTEFDGPDSAPRSFIRLLLVDRDPEARATLRKGLENRFEVAEASTAEEALAQLGERFFSVVLTDYQLPDHDGVWLLEQVCEKRPYMRRVLMSARSVPNVRGLRDAGVFQLFMAKPVEPEAFAMYFVSGA
jgi:DNA-binding NtrC family response regulator